MVDRRIERQILHCEQERIRIRIVSTKEDRSPLDGGNSFAIHGLMIITQTRHNGLDAGTLTSASASSLIVAKVFDRI